MRRRRTSIVPAIRIMAPSLERGLDESSRNYESDVSSIRYINEINIKTIDTKKKIFQNFAYRFTAHNGSDKLAK